MKYYTKEHQWCDLSSYKVGLSSFARQELGEIVYLKMPKINDKIEKGEEICILESTKSASDLYAPYAGTVTAINNDAINQINSDPEGLGWLLEITPAQSLAPTDFLDGAQYIEMLQS